MNVLKLFKRASDTLRKLTELPNAIRLCRALVRELVHYYENTEGRGPENALVAELKRQNEALRQKVIEISKRGHERDMALFAAKLEVKRLTEESDEACADCPPELKTWRRAWRTLKKERKAHAMIEAELQAKIDELNEHNIERTELEEETRP